MRIRIVESNAEIFLKFRITSTLFFVKKEHDQFTFIQIEMAWTNNQKDEFLSESKLNGILNTRNIYCSISIKEKVKSYLFRGCKE